MAYSSTAPQGGTAAGFLIATLATLAGAGWMAYGVHRVEQLRAQGVPVIAQVTGTSITRSSDGDQVSQNYAYTAGQPAVRYTGTFTAG